jgi:hypothetical protein
MSTDVGVEGGKKTKAVKAPKVVEEPPTCPVCIAPFTGTLRRPIHCSSCSGDTCAKCVEAYLLNIVDDPHCPHCKAQWNRAFLATACTKTYMQNAYMKKRQTLLFERERSFFPQYQTVAERELRAREAEKERIALETKTWALRTEVGKRMMEIREEMDRECERIRKTLYKEVYAEEARVERLNRRIERIRAGEDEKGEGEEADAEGAEGGAGAGAGAKSKREVAKFVRRCMADGCNGFLSSVWKCGLCSNWVCPDCFEVKGTHKDAEHTCKPDMLETAKLIKKDTKPCPECGEVIQKTSGCDQMWCISCHTPFSWETGRKVTSGIIHNPHYFQWMAQGGRGVPQNPGHIPCGGLPDVPYLQRILTGTARQKQRHLMEILRCCMHIQDVERNRYSYHIHPPNNEDLGVRFLMKDLGEDGYKAALARQETERLKSAEIRAALDAFLGASIDLFRRFDTDRVYGRTEGDALIEEVTKELDVLRLFIGDAFLAIGRSFNCSVPYIHEGWHIDHGKPSAILKAQRELAAERVLRRQEEALAVIQRNETKAEYQRITGLHQDALREKQTLEATLLLLENDLRAHKIAGETVPLEATAEMRRQKANLKEATALTVTLNEAALTAHQLFDANELRLQRLRG